MIFEEGRQRTKKIGNLVGGHKSEVVSMENIIIPKAITI